MSEIVYTTIKKEHAAQLDRLQKLAFPSVHPDELFTEAHFLVHADLFPEGTIVALDGDLVVGLGAGIFIDFDFDNPQHTLDDFIGGSYYGAHDPDGDWYYGTDVSVHPDYRRQGIGRTMYDLRKQVAIDHNKRGMIAGGVLPGFEDVKGQMSIEDYVQEVVDGKRTDPTLSFQLSQGFEVRGVLYEYFMQPESAGNASLIVWENPDYDPTK